MTDTDTSTHDWAALRRLAEAATPGGAWWDALDLQVDCGIPKRHASYIAAAHPAAVLALLARAERAEAERDAFERNMSAAATLAARYGAELDAARAEAARLRDALENVLGNAHMHPLVQAEAHAKAYAALAKEPGHE